MSDSTRMPGAAGGLLADASGAGLSIGTVLPGLYDVLQSRKAASPQESYTASLLQGHEDQLLKKIGEEATEVVMAAKDGDVGHLRYEIADLVYHLMVVMVRHDLTLDDLAGELDSRRRP